MTATPLQEPDAAEADAPQPDAPQKEISFATQEPPETGIDALPGSVASPGSSQLRMDKPRVQLDTSAHVDLAPAWQKHRDGIHSGPSMPRRLCTRSRICPSFYDRRRLLQCMSR